MRRRQEGRRGILLLWRGKAGEKVETEGMGKTEASKTIGELKEKTGM